jgi:hypothetical protein
VLARRKSWADRQAIRTGVWGEIQDGIPIKEENRASVWEFRKEGIEALLHIMQKSYRDKKVKAVIFGIDEGQANIKYAIFVQSGFLVPVGEDE